MGNLRVSFGRRLIALGATVSTSLVLAGVASAPAAAGPDIGFSGTTKSSVTYWNGVLLQAFREKGGGPGPLSRLAAIMNAGIFDALNSVAWSQTGYPRYEKYLTLDYVQSNVDGDLAVGYTARDLLSWAEPSMSSYFASKFTERYGSSSQAAARKIADAVVADMTRARTGDGSADPTGYTPDNVPGAWRPTQGCTAIGPVWGRVKPFTMTSTTQFRQPGPAASYSALMSSSTYASNLAEVRGLGRYNSTTRTADQTQAAWFWANDLDGTYKPPGQYLNTALSIANERYTDGLPIARLLALVSLAMADAGIAAWDMKYLTPVDIWRPESAIQLDPVNPDPTWQPLSADREGRRFSPCFPAWVSGHATFGAAWAGILRRAFGDNNTFTVGTEDPHAVGVTRTFTSFTAAATENALSRIWLGVHFRFDSDQGLTAGYGIADHVYNNYLKPEVIPI